MYRIIITNVIFKKPLKKTERPSPLPQCRSHRRSQSNFQARNSLLNTFAYRTRPCAARFRLACLRPQAERKRKKKEKKKEKKRLERAAAASGQ